MADNFLDWLARARRIQAEVAGFGLIHQRAESSRGSDEERLLVGRFDELVTNEALYDASRQLFVDAHYARAVEAAFKTLNNAVKTKARRDDIDGDKLMREVFTPNGPKLRLNSLRSRSHKDEQRGYMELFAGAMMGIRNPRAHEPRLHDDPETALELLTFANHLMRRLEKSTRTRVKKKKS